MLSGRKIRKPIDNASGGGIAPEEGKPVEPAPVKKESKPEVKQPIADVKVPENSDVDIRAPQKVEANPKTEPGTAVKPTPKPVVSDTVVKKPEATKSIKPETEKPVAETKKVTAGNSGGATIETEKQVSKPTVTENKPVKAEPKPEKTTPVVKTEEKPTASVKPEKKGGEPEVATHKEVKTAPKSTEANGVIFKVQLIALKGPMRDAEVTKVTKAMGEITNETLPSGLIRYYSGTSKTLSEAKDKLATAAKIGYKDAFIVGFKNGERFGPEKVKALENQ